MLKIYGSPRTSASRCYFLLEELGVPYETVDLDMMEKKEHKSPAYLEINPNGKVPALIDDDFKIWESVAINWYLAEKYRPELLGKTLQERGLVQQWSIWGLNELQAPLVDILIQMIFVPEARRDMNLVARSREKLPAAFQILEDNLKINPFVAGQNLTVADFNLATIANIAVMLQVPIDSYTVMKAWLERMQERPSYKRLVDMRKK